MRITSAWARVSAQNLTLKVAISSLTVCLIALSVLALKLSLKDPIIIERKCYAQAIQRASSKHTTQEVRAFVKDAIAFRFNSNAHPKTSFLSTPELRTRQAEQKELNSRQMKQTVVVNDVQTDKETVTIDADRLISVTGIRSAFPFPMKAQIMSVPRSESNPYGLMLKSVEVIKMEEKTNEKK